MKKCFLIMLALMMGELFLYGQTNENQPGPLLGPYFGQEEPATQSRIFAPGFISTDAGELNSVFCCDGKEFYFSRRGIPGKPSIIMVSKQIDGQWETPEPVEFTGLYSDMDLFITSDGGSLIFCSERPHKEGDKEKADHDFWISERQGDSWSVPVLFAEEVLSSSEDFYPVVTGSGNLYFNSQRGGYGTNDIYCAELHDGKYLAPEKLPEPVNSSSREFDAYVSGDDKMIIFSSTRPGGYGGSDIYLSYKNTGGEWSDPKNLGPEINSPYSEYGSMISPDGKFFFYTSTKNGSEDIYWISSAILDREPAETDIADTHKDPGEVFVDHLRKNWDDVHDVIMRFHCDDPYLKGVAVIDMTWQDGMLKDAVVRENTTGNSTFGDALIEAMRKWNIHGLPETWTSAIPIRTTIKGSDSPDFDESGILTGMVTDDEHDPVHGAMVVLQHENDPGITSDTLYTNREGIFIQTLLPPGRWDIQCSKQGFKPHISENIMIDRAKHLRHNITLDPVSK